MRWGLIISLFFLVSCNQGSQVDGLNKSDEKQFSIVHEKGLTILEVGVPFNAAQQAEKYVLYDKGTEKPKNIDGVTHFVPVPVERVGITSTTHLGFLNGLKKQNVIKAATNLNLFYDTTFLDEIENGEVVFIGGRKLETEAVIKENLDVLFAYAIDGGDYQELNRLRELGATVILASEFMEKEPLSKSAWIKFFANFFDEQTIKLADSVYYEIESSYENTRSLAAKAESKPTVMVGYPWKGSWYVSGGNSFQANYFKHSNAVYLWEALSQEGSVPLATEKVVEDALDAQFWINPGSIQNLARFDPIYQQFSAFKKRKVYSNYAMTNRFGANDYWESGALSSDKILKDLVHIFHPELLPNHSLIYYKLVE